MYCYRIASCGFVCELPKDVSKEQTDAILHTHSYDLYVQSLDDAQRLVYRHTVSSLLTNTMAPKKDQSTSRILTNNDYFNTTVAKLSDRKIFFPAPQLYQLECARNSTDAVCYFGNNQMFDEITDKIVDDKYQLRITHDGGNSIGVVGLFTGNATDVDENYQCKDYFDGVRLTCLQTSIG